MKRIIVVLGALIILGGGALYALLSPTFLPRDGITQVADLDCRAIPLAGPEDFEHIVAANGLVISSHLKRAPEFEANEGQLFWLDLTVAAEEQTAVPIITNYPPNFRPQGLSFLPNDTGGTLYAISHPRPAEPRHTIELFTLIIDGEERHWAHKNTLTDELLVSPNNLVALPDGTLFISNDNFDLGSPLQIGLDYALQRARSPLVYFDGKTFMDLGHDLILGNGITYQQVADETFIYRSDSATRTIYKYRILHEINNVEIDLIEAIELEGGPDNLIFGQDGNLYAAAHASTGLLYDHEFERSPAPTQVFQISPDGDVTLLYANVGEQHAAGSVALRIGNQLYVGQIFDEQLLSCRI